MQSQWLLGGDPFITDYAEILRSHSYGFVYLITNNVTLRKYLGKKSFHSVRKGKKHESDWRNYWGSSEPFKQHVIQVGADCFTREILSIHETPDLLSYYEVREMFLRDVLYSKLPGGMPEYFNDSLPPISFRRK